MLSLWFGAYDQGLAYAGLALGTLLTLRILNFADLTVDGSFALGGGAAAVLISQGVPIPLALLAAVALAAKKVEAFVKIGAYATIQAFSSICKVGLANNIPVYSVDPPDIDLAGCLGVIGWTYVDDGEAAGRLAVRIPKGESPATMPFEPLSKTTLLLNGATAKAIGVSLPQALLQQADTLVKP